MPRGSATPVGDWQETMCSAGLQAHGFPIELPADPFHLSAGRQRRWKTKTLGSSHPRWRMTFHVGIVGVKGGKLFPRHKFIPRRKRIGSRQRARLEVKGDNLLRLNWNRIAVGMGECSLLPAHKQRVRRPAIYRIGSPTFAVAVLRLAAAFVMNIT